MGRILRVFFDVDMRNSHDGLRMIADCEKIKLDNLQKGEYVIFINSKKTHVKMFAQDNVLAFLKLDYGKIDLNTISRIPKAFESRGKFEYDKELKTVLIEKLGRK